MFSASLPETYTYQFIRLAVPHVVLLTCELAVEEATRNLLNKRPDGILHLPELLAKVALTPTSIYQLPFYLAPKDCPILCSALNSKCDFLLTGDRRDFGHLFGKPVFGLQILPIEDFAAMMEVEGW